MLKTLLCYLIASSMSAKLNPLAFDSEFSMASRDFFTPICTPW